MSGLLIFALLSFVVLYKLFRSFGRVQYINIKHFEDTLKEKMVNITENAGNDSDIVKLQEVLPEYATKDIKGDLEQIFIRVFKAFADSRYQDLKSMLTEHLYESFSEVIRKREDRNLRQELDIKDVIPEISHLEISSKIVCLDVIFKVSQMSATVNQDGVSFDNPSRLYIDVVHKWIFEREISENSSWLVMKTSIVE